MRYLLTIAYDGTNYNGWQRQPDKKTIQGEIEAVLSRILNVDTQIHGSGRTDAGVHAYAQTAHFDCEDELDIEKFRYSLNALLPKDIVISSLRPVDEAFHARYDAKKKHYQYLIVNEERTPFLRDQVLFLHQKLDLLILKENLAKFKGVHNFQNFTTKDEDEFAFVREIYHTEVRKDGDLLTILFVGEGFMRAQIRLMVGALIGVSLGKLHSDYIDTNLDPGGPRSTISEKAPAQGLYLLGVDY